MTLYSPTRMGIRGLSQYNPSPTGCLLYLPLWSNYLKGATFRSQDNYRRLCTVTGTTQVTTGRDLDGTDDKISCGSPVAVTTFSFGFWVKPDNWATDTSFMYNTGYFLAIVASGKLYFDDFNDGGNRVQSAGTYSGSAWRHLFYTSNGSGTKAIYVNGASVSGAGAASSGEDDTDSALMVGKRDIGATHQFVNGIFGDVWVYDRVLSAGEVLRIYKQTVGRYQ